MFGADSEGLLPVHYIAERADKDLLQFIVEVGSSSDTSRGGGDVNLVFLLKLLL